MKLTLLAVMLSLLLLGGCTKPQPATVPQPSVTESPANATAAFLGSADEWQGCRIILDDIQGLWGGTAVIVDGSGKCIIRIVKHAPMESRYSLNLTADEGTALRKLLIDVDFVNVQSKNRDGVPDEARPTITLQNSQGKEQSTAKWAGDKVEGFDSVFRVLLDLQTKTEKMKPEYEGKYQRDWLPPATTTAIASKPATKDGLQVTAVFPSFAQVAVPSGQKPQSAIVVSDGNVFATDLYAKLAADKPGNLFFSPMSINTALAMTYAGAAGNTADQMAKTLHFTLPPDKLSVAYAELLKTLNNPAKVRDPSSTYDKPVMAPAYQLVVANALWGQKGYAFKPDFTTLLQHSYGAGLNDVDFGQTEQARKTINDWVAQQTKDKIKDLIPKDVLSDLTRLVLTNAIYFKSNWAEKFTKEATKDGPFKLSADKSVDVPMMHMQMSFSYMENDDLQLLELPYVAHELSMVILLPKKVDGVADIEKNLTSGNIDRWLNDKKPVPVEVTLPKFKFSSEFMPKKDDLADALKSLGMTDAFDKTKADFSGMNDALERLYIAAVIHKAFVAVDEEGTEAVAATAVIMAGLAAPHPPVRPVEPKIFKADHPFIFIIRHNSTGDILFMGRLANPKE